MRKDILDTGFTVYFISPTTQKYLQKIKAFGNRCDNCSKEITGVIYVPALNCGMCKECFLEWKNRAIYYEEDRWFEDDYIKWIESLYIKSILPS